MSLRNSNGNGRSPSSNGHPSQTKDPQLDNDLRETLKESLSSKTLEGGMPVYSQKEDVEEFFLVEEGLLGIYRFVPPNKRILLHKIRPGETVGVTQLLRSESYPAHLVPLDQAEAHRGSRSELESLSQEDPGTLNELIVLETAAHNRIFEKIEGVLCSSVDERIARELLNLAQRLRPDETPPEIPINLTREDISRMVGCSKESASRVMSEWEQNGTIDTNNQRITIHNLDELRGVTETTSE